MKSNLKTQYKTLFYLFLLFFVVACSNEKSSKTQNDSNQKQNKIGEQKTLLRDYFANEIKTDSIVLIDKPYTFETTECLDKIAEDFPKNDFSGNNLLNQSLKDTTFWSVDVIPMGKILSNKKLPNKLDGNGWKVLFRSLDKGYYVLSRPLFNKDLTLGILHVEFYKGFKAGEGKTILLRKNGNKWQVIKVYCNWMS